MTRGALSRQVAVRTRAADRRGAGLGVQLAWAEDRIPARRRRGQDRQRGQDGCDQPRSGQASQRAVHRFPKSGLAQQRGVVHRRPGVNEGRDEKDHSQGDMDGVPRRQEPSRPAQGGQLTLELAQSTTGFPHFG